MEIVNIQQLKFTEEEKDILNKAYFIIDSIVEDDGTQEPLYTESQTLLNMYTDFLTNWSKEDF